MAIVVSLVALAQQAADPPVRVLGRKRGTNVFRPPAAENPDDETFPGVLLLRLEGRLFFVNAERVAEKIRPLIAEYRPRYVVLDMSGLFDLGTPHSVRSSMRSGAIVPRACSWCWPI